jgi:endogenous inhibitor of DNA gyrase (YacG/DUF329 family)
MGKIKFKCDYCGKDVKVPNWKLKKNFKKHFCNDVCYVRWQGLTIHVGKCEICGKDIRIGSNRYKNKKHHFCSKSCSYVWKTTRINCQCDYCGKNIYVTPFRLNNFKNHFCNNKCHSKWMSENVPCGINSILWKGGKYKAPDGYIYVRFPHGECIAEHRLIMEQYLGRKLTKKEIIHHINGIRDDNRIDNLCIVVSKTHEKHTLVKRCQERIIVLETMLGNIYGCPN